MDETPIEPLEYETAQGFTPGGSTSDGPVGTKGAPVRQAQGRLPLSPLGARRATLPLSHSAVQTATEQGCLGVRSINLHERC